MSRKLINDKNKKTAHKIDALASQVSPFAGLRREQHLRRLEPRIMFDGAAVATIDVATDGADAGQDASAPVLPAGNPDDTSQAAGQASGNEPGAENQIDPDAASDISGSNDPKTFIFIDAAVSNPSAIIASADPNAEIYILDPASDGLAQIAFILQGEANIDAVHIISHGNSGELILGNQAYDANALADHASDLAIIGNALSEDGDILLYGCNIADSENGIRYLDSLAALTGADIAASDDDTGAAALGGDWDLEASTGDIEAASLAATEWNGLLAPLSISASAPPTVDTSPIPVGGSTVWTNAGFIGSTAIDLRATVVSADPGVVVLGLTIGDDPSLAIDTGGFGFGGTTAGDATVRWEIFEAGTGQTVFAIGAPKFTVSDIDGSGSPNTIETIAPELNGLQSYTVDPSSALNVTTSGGVLEASGTDDDSSAPGGPLRLSAAITFNWSERSSWDITYTAERSGDGRIFAHDGDGDFVFTGGITTTLLGIDLDDNNSTATGISYNGSFIEGSAAVPIVDGDVTISQNAALGTNLGSASITLTNAQAGDVLAVGALPPGITANINTTVAGEITVTLSGDASLADYETALKAITFENTSNDPATTDRQIQVSVTNTTFGTSSLAALSTISVTSVNDAPAGADNTIAASEDTPHSFTSSEFGFSDTDGDSLQLVIITTLPNAADGVLSLNGTPVTAGQEIPAAQITNLAFASTSNINGNGLGAFTFEVKDDGGTANGGEDTDQSPNTISFNIAPVNDVPDAVNDTGTTDEDTAISIGAAAGLIDPNDTDPENDTLNVSKVNGVAGDVGNQITLPSGALLTVNADGSYDYDPNGVFEGLAAGETGADSFTYEVSDGNGGTDTATVNLTINGVNDAPSAVDDTSTTDEDTAISANAATGLINPNDTDPDGTDVLTVSEVNGVPGNVGNQITLSSGALLTVNADGSYEYDPNGAFDNLAAGATGSDSFTYQISDGNGGTDTATVNLTINGINDAPVADDESVITDEDVPVTIDILDGDTDIDGTIDPASVGIEGPANPGTYAVSVTEAGVGTWTVDTNPASPTHGQITFTPVLHYNGPVTPITYQVADNDGATTTATVDVALDGVNDVPVANPESFNVNEDSSILNSVLANDTDVDGHPLTVTSATVDIDGDGVQDVLTIGGAAVQLTNAAGDPIGAFGLGSDGSFVFQPAPNYDGPVPQVTYTIDDGNGGTAVSTLDLTITPINDAPVLDLDADDSSLVIGDGFKNTFTEDGGPVAAIDGDVSIIDTDDTGMAQAIIAVGGLADGANEILTIGSTSIALNASHTGTVTIGGTTFLIVYSAGTGNIGISNNAGGDMPIADLEALLASITYENTSQNPTAGDRTLDVRVSDGDVFSNIAVSTITVAPVNDAPTAVDDTSGTNEDTAISINAAAGLITPNDTDPENDTLNVSKVNGVAGDVGNQITLPSGALLTVNADGSYDYDPNGAFEGLAAGETGADSFTYEVSDGNGGTDTATVNLTINGVNDSPDAVDDTGTTDEDTAISVNVATGLIDPNDTDPDGTDVLTISQVNGVPANVGNQITLASGALLTVNANGSYDYDPNGQFENLAVGATGSDSFTYEVSDGNGGTDNATVNLTINGVNDTPDAVDDIDSTDEDTATIGNVITGAGTDTDPDSDPLTVTGATQGANALTIGAPFTTAGGGVLTLNADGSYDFNPGTAYNGLDVGETATEVVTYTVDDGNGGTDTATLTITINGANDAPVPVDPANPGPDPSNPIPGNPATVIPTQPVDDGEDFTGTPLVDASTAFVDPDGEPLTFTSISTLPAGLTLNPDGTITGTIDKGGSQGGPGSDGLYPITITATDPDGATAAISFTIDVSNPAPVAVDDVASVGEDAPNVSGNVITDALTGDADAAPDSDPLTVTDAVQGANVLTIGAPFTTAGGGVLTLNADGSYDFDPGTAYNGLDVGETATEVVTYTVDDGNGGTDTATLTITINGSNDAPVPVDPANPGPDPSNPIPGNPLTVIPTQPVDDGEDFTVNPLVDASTAFVDPDGEPLTFTSISTLPAGLTLNPDGTITGTINNQASQGGPANDGLYPITITATDPDGATITFTIDVSNLAPVAVDDVASVGEDTPNVSGNVITDAVTGDADAAPDTDPLTVTGAVQGANALTIGAPFTTAGGGVLTLNANGSYSFDPGTAYNGLDVGETATETITYTVDDGNGGTDTATLTVTINGANDAPVPVDPANPGPDPSNPIPGNPLTVIPTQPVDDGEDFTVNPLVDASTAFVDPDGEPLTFTTADPLPTGLTLNPDGTITGTINNQASQGGPANDGLYPITITATDPDGATATITFTIDVSNPAPIAIDDVASVGEDTPLVVGNVITDAATGDADTAPDSDPLTVTGAVQGAGASANALTIGVPFTTAGGGVLTLNADGSYDFDPGTSYNGLDVGETATETITYTVDDGNGGTDTATLTVTVNGANDAPVPVDPANPGPDPSNPIPGNPLTVIPTQPVDDGEDFTVNPLVDASTAFVDPDGETLTFTTPGPLPTGLTLNPDGTITGTINNQASQGGPANDGLYPITITATDPDGATATITFTIDVSNPAPVAVNDDATVDQDRDVIIPVLSNDFDPDGDPLTVFSATATNGTVTINPDGTITYKPNPGHHGGDTITYVISDGNGGFATATVELTINATGINLYQMDDINRGQSLFDGNANEDGNEPMERDPFDREIIHEFIRLIVEGRLHELEVQFGLEQDNSLVRAVQDLTREHIENGSTVREMLGSWDFWRQLDDLDFEQLIGISTLAKDLQTLDFQMAGTNLPIDMQAQRELRTTAGHTTSTNLSTALSDEKNQFDSDAQRLATDIAFG